MEWVFAIAVYFVTWWIVLFAVLPYFARPQHEAGEIVPGTPESAPADFSFWRLVLVNTLVSLVVFAGLWALIVFDPWQLGQPPDLLPQGES
ncbi:MAG: DUF1467 family protein [Pseudomonadota bacterium]